MGKVFIEVLEHGTLSTENQLLCHNCFVPLCYAKLDVIRDDY